MTIWYQNLECIELSHKDKSTITVILLAWILIHIRTRRKLV